MKVLITCGPTWVPIDDVRVISNVSTGEMGHLIAGEFLNTGAQVTLIEGAVTHPWSSKGVKVLKYRFFDELAKLLKQEAGKKYDIIIHAAAVSDFKVAKVSKSKIDSTRALDLHLVPVAKLIQSIKKQAPLSFLVGFKLESKLTPAKMAHATRSLFVESGCEVVVANTINNGYQGYIINADGDILAKASRKEILVKHLVKLLR